METNKKHIILIILASAALLGLAYLQLNWIKQAHDLKHENIQKELQKISDDIAVAMETEDIFTWNKIARKEQDLNLDSVGIIVAAVLKSKEFDEEVNYAIFQKKENGIFESNALEQEQALKNSEHATCLSCIMTVMFSSDSLRKISPDMVFIRSVEQTEKLPNKGGKEDFIWLSIHVPKESLLSKKSILGFVVLTLLLMILLVFIFGYTIRALSKQRKLSQLKDDFFNNMTHEFKTPLSSILLSAKMLKQNFDQNKKDIYINLIENESKKLEGQVDKILQLSLIDSNKMEMDKTEINLHEIIIEIKERLGLIIAQKNAHIELLLNLENDDFIGDYAHLSNSIYNLVENALKYSGEKTRIIISTYQNDNKKCISVKDSGNGIPKEFQAEIFDRFFRAQKNDQYKGKGFGIGLSYVKAIIEAHHGTIILNQEYKDGAEFIIKL